MRLEPVRLRWERRATELNADIVRLPEDAPDEQRERLKRKRKYAVDRVQRLRADIAPRLMTCATEGLPIACKCGPVGAKKTCRQWWLCRDCRAKRSPSLCADIRRGLDAALEREVTAWGRRGGVGTKPQIVLLTLTQKHSGNLSADQSALALGWRKLYKRMNEDYAKFPYVAVWEVTRGRDGLGHVHMHIAVVWAYRKWSRVRKQWERACPSSQYITFVKKRRDKETGREKASSPASVANYLGKYLSKGVDVNAFDGTLRAETSAAFYNQRSVFTSLHFWQSRVKCCRKCNERYRLVEVEPVSFFETVPNGVLNLYFHGLEPPNEPPVTER